MSLYDLARSLLFRLEPETAHTIGLAFMPLLRDARVDDPSLRVKTAIGELDNPIGLAAGYDKNGTYLRVLEKLGFGYLVAGTVTKPPWPGHPKPRIVRNPADKTIINAMGFPNLGLDAIMRNISSQGTTVPIVGNISGQTIPDIIECYERLQPYVAGIELNLSSPNTAKLTDLREPEPFTELATQMATRRKKPTYLKITPYRDDAQFSRILELVRLWSRLGFEGVTSGNTIPMDERRVTRGAGGLSGPPLFPKTIKAIREIRKVVPAGFEVNAVGGISNSGDVKTALSEGATTVQIYTALVFEGPRLIHKVLKELSTSQ